MHRNKISVLLLVLLALSLTACGTSQKRVKSLADEQQKGVFVSPNMTVSGQSAKQSTAAGATAAMQPQSTTNAQGAGAQATSAQNSAAQQPAGTSANSSSAGQSQEGAKDGQTSVTGAAEGTSSDVMDLAAVLEPYKDRVKDGKVQLKTDPKFFKEEHRPVAEVNLADAPHGVEGRKVAAFFKLLSEPTLKYVYAQRAGSSEICSLMYLAMANDETYLSVYAEGVQSDWVKPAGQGFFFLNHLAKTFEPAGDSQLLRQLSSLALSQVTQQAQALAYIGSGHEDFAGQKADFEEYTIDGKTYTRYYFDQDGKCLGHCRIKDGHVDYLLEILTLDSKVDSSIFRLPRDYRMNTAKRTTTSTTSAEPAESTAAPAP